MARKKEEPVVRPSEKYKRPTFDERWEETLKQRLFEEEQKKLEDEEDSDYFEQEQELVHKHRDGEWDVPLDEPIEYFDPELSYELTGYRPITLTDGLDFDPAPFSQIAEQFENTKKYTEFPRGCKPYKDFWDEQKRRCVEGYTVGKYRVTGDHYFFLNFYRMQSPKISGTDKKTVGRGQSFPRFLSKQYEFFHYFEMCEILGKDVIMLKARGLGFSEMLACLAVRPFITTREFRTVITAAADAQLDPLLDKCWTQLNWLNMNTDGGMKRSRQKVDNVKQKRASLVNKENVEFGRMSEIEGIVADNPRKVRGDRTERLIYEEAGSNTNLITSWIQGDSLVNLGGIKVGVKIGGGTGGDSGPQLAGLSKMFYNPKGYKVLPFKHKYTKDLKYAYTGYFIPAHAFALDPKYLDERGVTDENRFRKFYEDQWDLMEDAQDRLTDQAEHCFTPEDALIKQGDNLFDSVALAERLMQIKVHGDYIKPKRMQLLWDKSGGDESRTKVTAHESASSQLLVVEPPLLDETGSPYKNLYVAGIDSIDLGKKDSASDYDVSDFCIVIKKRIFGLNEPRYVAIYKARPNDIREAYDVAMKLLVWYNCKALLEYTKVSIVEHFKHHKKQHLFMARPDFASPNKSSGFRRTQPKQLIGLPATEAVIRHQLELIQNFVNDYWFTIDYEDIIQQLLNYSYEQKRKFDVVAAMGMCEVADEELTGIMPTPVKNKKSEWKDIGWYTDARGIKRYGVLPGKSWKT